MHHIISYAIMRDYEQGILLCLLPVLIAFACIVFPLIFSLVDYYTGPIGIFILCYLLLSAIIMSIAASMR